MSVTSPIRLLTASIPASTWHLPSVAGRMNPVSASVWITLRNWAQRISTKDIATIARELRVDHNASHIACALWNTSTIATPSAERVGQRVDLRTLLVANKGCPAIHRLVRICRFIDIRRLNISLIDIRVCAILKHEFAILDCHVGVDIVIAKLCSFRDTDRQDVISPEVLKEIDWDLLEKLATDEDELKANISDRGYSEFMYNYEEYVRRFRP